MSQTQVLPGSNDMTDEIPLSQSTPAAMGPASMPGAPTRPGTSPRYASNKMMDLDDNIVNKFNELYMLVDKAIKTAKSPADSNMFNSRMREMKKHLDEYVLIDVGGRRKTKRKGTKPKRPQPLSKWFFR
jgi:hypothetical protein